MPEIISCPECDRKLRVSEDLLGKKVRCPGCSVLFTARADAPSDEAVAEQPRARRRDDEDDDRRSRRRDDDKDYDDRPSRRRDDEDYDDRPSRRRRDEEDEDASDRGRRRSRRDDEDDRPRKPRGERKAWDRVVLGLKLTIIGGWVGVGAALVSGLSIILVGCFGVGTPTLDVDATINTGAILTVMACLKVLAQLGEVGLVGTGAGFTMMVPPSRNEPLKPLGITAFALAATSAVLVLVGSIVAFTSFWGSFAIIMPFGVGGTGVVLSLADLAGLAYLIIFLLFLRSIGRAVRERQLGDRFMSILIAFAILGGIGAILYILVWTGAVASMFTSSRARSFKEAQDSMKTGRIVIGVLGALMVLASVGLRIWYLFTIMPLRDAIDRYARRIGSS